MESLEQILIKAKAKQKIFEEFALKETHNWMGSYAYYVGLLLPSDKYSKTTFEVDNSTEYYQIARKMPRLDMRRIIVKTNYEGEATFGVDSSQIYEVDRFQSYDERKSDMVINLLDNEKEFIKIPLEELKKDALNESIKRFNTLVNLSENICIFQKGKRITFWNSGAKIAYKLQVSKFNNDGEAYHLYKGEITTHPSALENGSAKRGRSGNWYGNFVLPKDYYIGSKAIVESLISSFMEQKINDLFNNEKMF